MRLLLSASLALLSAAFAPHIFAADDFVESPDHRVNESIPHGTVTQMPQWESKVFPDTVRDWWVYVPAQFKPDGSAAVMVFQDGSGYKNTTGDWRIPTVFDNLIAKGDMPPTVAIFINPGNAPLKPGEAPRKRPDGRPAGATNRSFEYDSLGDRYAKFLLEEILPEVEKKWPLTKDPEMRAICGASSGGICSFTVAWEHPEAFRKVLSTIGSFTNIRGGNAYPSLIRKTERKPIRVFLQDSSGDLDNQFGNWPIANQQMHAALKYMGYDVKFDYVEGYGHNSKHGGSIMPDALRWLWRKEKHVPVIDTKGDLGGDMTLHRLLIEGEGWQPVVEGLAFCDGPMSDAEGNFYFSDMKGDGAGIYKISPDGKKTKLSSEGVSGLKFGPDGRLYACQGSKKRLIAIDLKTNAIEELATDVQPNDLVVSAKGHIYFTHTGKKEIVFVDAKTKEKRVVDTTNVTTTGSGTAVTGINAPNGITLSPDQGTLAVSDYRGANVWTFRVNADGTLDAKAPTMTMRLPIDPKGEFKMAEPPPYNPASGGDGMCSDELGRFYVATTLGVQVFDPTSRLCGVITRPQLDKPLTSCTLSGEGRAYLYVTNGDKIFRRKVQATGSIFYVGKK
jgi:enterochelin esterase-like enzyme/sugar lactone lactonase YvrE